MFLSCCDSTVKIVNSNSQSECMKGWIIIGGKFVLIHRTPAQTHLISSRLSFRHENFQVQNGRWDLAANQEGERERKVNRYE